VKLLFDQNLSLNLVAHLADIVPQSLHVREAELECADDLSVWRFALERVFAIVTNGLGLPGAQPKRQFGTRHCLDSARQLLHAGH